jgi:H/ACA ribonucleoprotein complex subunit 3
MMSPIMYCQKCKDYTLDTICRKCRNKTILKKPARYSPQDHYGKYRRELKRLDKKG